MLPTCNQAARELISTIDDEFIFAQALILRREPGFELRHVDDRDVDADSLRRVETRDLRELAKFSSGGAFRPLKSCPNLQTGWSCPVDDEGSLEEALNHLYPGALADWNAIRSGTASASSYREFTGRQTGMYRLTQLLEDALVRDTVSVVCKAENCLKRRIWEAPGMDADAPDAKSCIPCLEPCAPLLEFARTVMRAEQGGKATPELTVGDAEVIQRALARAKENPVDDVRAADFGSLDNPMRIQLALNRLNAALDEASDTQGH